LKSLHHRPVFTLMDRYLRREFVHFVSVSILILAITCVLILFTTPGKKRTIFGPVLGADYAGFYMAGTLLNNFPPERLYDLRLQEGIFHQTHPEASADEVLTFVYTPFFALLFQPLARLPYVPSFALWLSISVALSLASMILMLGTASAIPAVDRSIVLLLALSFEPLIFECWLGGQASAFGMFWIALALARERRGGPFTAGLALGVLSYKPTLLILILPMLVCSRRWRMMGGFALCAIGLLCLSLAVVGWHGFLNYLDGILHHARLLSRSEMSFRTAKYVDFLSFFKLLLGVSSPFARPLALAISLPALIALIAMWARVVRLGRDRGELAFAGTLTWTPILNFYSGVYDTIVIIPGLVLTADILHRRAQAGHAAIPRIFNRLLALLYIAPWLSSTSTGVLGFQPLTLALVLMGAYQVLLVLQDRRWTTAAHCPDEDGNRNRNTGAVILDRGS
jgi:Glycosyltransferase family 87